MDSSSRNVARCLGKGWMDDEATEVSSLFSSRINSLESSGTNKARNIKVRAKKRDQHDQGRSHHKSRSETDHNGRPNDGRNSDQNGEASARETSSIHILNKKNVLRQDDSIGRLCKHCNKLFDNTTTYLQHLYKVVQKKELLNQGNKDIQHDSGIATKFTKGSSHKKARPKVRQVSEPETKVMYKCELCNACLPTRNKCTQHRNKHHTEWLGHLIFEKVLISIEKPKPLQVPDISVVEHEQREEGDSSTTAPRILKLHKCKVCNVYFDDEHSCRQHVTEHVPLDYWTYMVCPECGLRFENRALLRHRELHRKNITLDKVVIASYQPINTSTNVEVPGGRPIKTDSANGTSVEAVDAAAKPATETAPRNLILHKCKVCNVHFDDQPSCHQHVTAHVPLDYWTYMVCPECGLRFENLALLRHRELHRKNITLDKVVIASYQPINTSTNVEVPGGRPIKTDSANATSVEAVDSTAKPATETNGKLLDRYQVEVSTENRRIIIKEGNNESPNHSEPSEGPQTAEVAHRNDIIRRSIADGETLCWVADYENIEVKQELLPANSSDAFDKDIQCNTNKQITSVESIIPRVNMIKIEKSEKHDDSNASQCIKIETKLNKEFNINIGSSATKTQFHVRVKADSVSDVGSDTDGRYGQNVNRRQSGDTHSTSVRRKSLTANDIRTQQPSTSTSICTKPRKFDGSSRQTSTYLNAEQRELNTISKGANLPTSSIEKSIETRLKRASTLVNIPSTSTSPDGKNYKTKNQLEDIQRLFTAPETVRRVPLITGNQIPNLTATTTNDGSNEQNQSKQAHDSNIKSTKDQEKSKLEEGDDDVIVVSNEEISIVIDSDSDIDEEEIDKAIYLFALSNEY